MVILRLEDAHARKPGSRSTLLLPIHLVADMGAAELAETFQEFTTHTQINLPLAMAYDNLITQQIHPSSLRKTKFVPRNSNCRINSSIYFCLVVTINKNIYGTKREWVILVGDFQTLTKFDRKCNN